MVFVDLKRFNGNLLSCFSERGFLVQLRSVAGIRSVCFLQGVKMHNDNIPR